MSKSIKERIFVANDVRDCVRHAERTSDRQDDGTGFPIKKDREFGTVIVSGVLEPEIYGKL